MTLNVPQIKANTPINAVKKDISETAKIGHAKQPSFGFKPIEIPDEGRIFRTIEGIGDKVNPAWQRGISGITALFTQPFFDWNNKRVDEDTRKASTARTIGKIIAGTATGVLIREVCIRAMKYFTQNENTVKDEVIKAQKNNKTPKITKFVPTKWNQFLLPEKYKKAITKDIKNYRSTIGTFIAIGIMIVTNFLIDAPLTNYIANIFNKYLHRNDSNQTEGGNK